eukprot:TRINITY_DN14221_c0_g1_i2.p1 TRINITY_DN14221_c0_g1~~TRINITY_DN14221_c0_g1_i2.p1  ORF type:complete len:177 (-),score=13.04 TRINITY_DN14221_c0_g1_i2:69-599(-)
MRLHHYRSRQVSWRNITPRQRHPLSRCLGFHLVQADALQEFARTTPVQEYVFLSGQGEHRPQQQRPTITDGASVDRLRLERFITNLQVLINDFRQELQSGSSPATTTRTDEAWQFRRPYSRSASSPTNGDPRLRVSDPVAAPAGGERTGPKYRTVPEPYHPVRTSDGNWGHAANAL